MEIKEDEIRKLLRQTRISALNGILEVVMKLEIEQMKLKDLRRELNKALAHEMDQDAEEQISYWQLNLPQSQQAL